jgi:hypothetical protein
MPWKRTPIYPRAHITTLQLIAIAEKIAMQFMPIASLHYDFPTGTPRPLTSKERLTVAQMDVANPAQLQTRVEIAIGMEMMIIQNIAVMTAITLLRFEIMYF